MSDSENQRPPKIRIRASKGGAGIRGVPKKNKDDRPGFRLGRCQSKIDGLVENGSLKEARGSRVIGSGGRCWRGVVMLQRTNGLGQSEIVMA